MRSQCDAHDETPVVAAVAVILECSSSTAYSGWVANLDVESCQVSFRKGLKETCSSTFKVKNFQLPNSQPIPNRL